MGKLVCEICGGKLVGKPGGVFECDSCGTEYSKEWCQEKIQEIKGTVKVEGTVQVAGTVEVKGGVNLEKLLKRGNIALEDGRWREAEKQFQNALNHAPEHANAYLGLFLAGQKQPKLNECDGLDSLDEDALRLYERAVQYAAPEQKTQMENTRQANILVQEGMNWVEDQEWEKADACFDRALELDSTHPEAWRGKVMTRWKTDLSDAEWYLHRQEDSFWQNARRNASALLNKKYKAIEQEAESEAAMEEKAQRLRPYLERSRLGASMIHFDSRRAYALKSDGTVLTQNGHKDVENWRGITRIAYLDGALMGLRADGTVAVSGGDRVWPQKRREMVEGWHDIVNIGVCGQATVYGVKADGSVVSAGQTDTKWEQAYLVEWLEELKGQRKKEYDVQVRDCWWDVDGSVHPDGDYEDLDEDLPAFPNVKDIIDSDGEYLLLKADGTVTCVPGHKDSIPSDVRKWKDIIALYGVRDGYIVGLRKDGVLLQTWKTNLPEYCGIPVYNGVRLDVNGWKLFDSIDTLEQELAASAEKALPALREETRRRDAERARLREAERARQQKIADLTKQQQAALDEYASLGILAFKRKKELVDFIARCDTELDELRKI